jgi:hypothetical protein
MKLEELIRNRSLIEILTEIRSSLESLSPEVFFISVEFWVLGVEFRF